MRLLLPDYFAALELTPQADEAEVKRAYAQRLKQINRQADPQRFQELRAHYEAALAHVREGRGFVMVDEAPEPLAEAQHAPVAPGGDARLHRPLSLLGLRVAPPPHSRYLRGRRHPLRMTCADRLWHIGFTGAAFRPCPRGGSPCKRSTRCFR